MTLFDRLDDDAPRVAFVGIDGVPYSLIEDEPGTFPNLTAMIDEGTGGPIDSVVPPESSACWPALTTGKNPGETGVYGFQDREPGSYDTYVPVGRHVEAPRLWDRVREAGRSATVMNVPVTYPPDRSTRRMVSGFLSPDVERASHPEETAEYLESIGYRLDVNARLGHQADKTDFLADARATLDARFEAFSHYVEADDWDLFFGVFMSTDRVNHFLFEDYERDGEYREDFLEFYARVDDYLGRLRDRLPDDVTMIVASDHGFTTLDYEVDLNAWLRREGWLSFRDGEEGSLSGISGDARAYALIPGRLYLNLEGREPRGSVPEDEYEAVRAELADALREVTGPDGRPVVERVVTREEAFEGAFADRAPDLVALPTDGFDLKAGFGGGEVFSRGPRNGMHTFDDATLVADAGAELGDDLLSIAPLVTSLMELEPEAEVADD